MKILFLGKRFYTNRDALLERYGRIFQLPFCWHNAGEEVLLWLVDYHSKEKVNNLVSDHLLIKSMPVCSAFFLVTCLRQMLGKDIKPNIIVASGDCYIGFLGWILAKIIGARFIFDIYDKYDEFKGYIRPFGWDIFKFLRNTADTCFFASRILPESLGGVRDTDVIVSNGIDLNHFRPLDMLECRSKWDLVNEDYLVGYFGSMEVDRGVFDLVSAVRLLKAQGLSIRLVVGGRIEDKSLIEGNDVIYLGDIPYQEMPTILACCNVLALPYRRSAIMDAGASNKIIEYIAVERPIAATKTPNLLKNFLRNEDQFIEYMAKPGDPESLAQCIKMALETPIKLEIPPNSTWQEIGSISLRKLKQLI